MPVIVLGLVRNGGVAGLDVSSLHAHSGGWLRLYFTHMSKAHSSNTAVNRTQHKNAIQTNQRKPKLVLVLHTMHKATFGQVL